MSPTLNDQADPPTDFEPGRLAVEACRRTDSDRQPLRYLDSLAVLCAALDSEAGLTRAGRARARRSLVSALVNQCQVRQMLAGDPAVGRVPLVAPVFVTGLLRTGTTFLQQLLSCHPDMRAPRLWELMAPADRRPRVDLIASGESYVDSYYQLAPAFRDIHPLGVRLPEECHRLTGNTFRDPIYALRYRLPSYVAWLREQSMRPAYEFHRTQLRCLLARRDGETGGGTVLLKGPSHLWYLDELAEVYPDARIIRLHRSPSECVPSVCSLTEVVRGATAAGCDRAEIGRYWLESVGPMLDSVRPGQSWGAGPVLDIRYADLVADPLRTVAVICEYLGLPLTREAAARMSRLLARRSGGTSVHRYTAEDYGLTADGLDQRFAQYRDAFDIR